MSLLTRGGSSSRMNSVPNQEAVWLRELSSWISPSGSSAQSLQNPNSCNLDWIRSGSTTGAKLRTSRPVVMGSVLAQEM